MIKSIRTPEHYTYIYSSDLSTRCSTCCWDLTPLVRSNTDVGDQVWLTVGVPVHPKGVGCDQGLGFEQASQVLLNHTGRTISLWGWFCTC